jgi:hypothetical protein
MGMLICSLIAESERMRKVETPMRVIRKRQDWLAGLLASQNRFDGINRSK